MRGYLLDTRIGYPEGERGYYEGIPTGYPEVPHCLPLRSTPLSVSLSAGALPHLCSRLGIRNYPVPGRQRDAPAGILVFEAIGAGSEIGRLAVGTLSMPSAADTARSLRNGPSDILIFMLFSIMQFSKTAIRRGDSETGRYIYPRS